MTALVFGDDHGGRTGRRGLRLVRWLLGVVVSCLLMSLCVGCGTMPSHDAGVNRRTSSQMDERSRDDSSDGNAQSSGNDFKRQDPASRGGRKLASSLGEFIDQLMADNDIADSQKNILERAKRSGGVSISDYERSWSDYKQCMLDRGYKQIILIKYPNGLYVEAMHRQGTGPQESQYSTDAAACGNRYTTYVDQVFRITAANPGLLADQSEAAVDCLRREELVPRDYTVERFNEELGMDSSLAGKRRSFDANDRKVAGCLVANGIRIEDVAAAKRNGRIETLW